MSLRWILLIPLLTVSAVCTVLAFFTAGAELIIECLIYDNAVILNVLNIFLQLASYVHSRG